MTRYLAAMLWCTMIVSCTPTAHTAALPTPSLSPETTPTRTPLPTVDPTRQLYVSHNFRIAFELPAELHLNPGAMSPWYPDTEQLYLNGNDYVMISGISEEEDPVECQEEPTANSSEAVAELRPITINGQEACFMMMAQITTGEMGAVLVVRYPERVRNLMLGATFEYVMVYSSVSLMADIIDSLRFKITPQEYLVSAMDYMEMNSMYAGDVDWQALRTKYLKDRMTMPMAHQAIKLIIRDLNDEHAYLWTTIQVERLMVPGRDPNAPDMPSGEIIDDPSGYLNFLPILGDSPVPKPLNQDTDAPIAYILLPPVLGHSQVVRDYADAVQAQIRSLDETDPCGWIVDLRGNTGGSILPMIVGIGPLLGDGHAFAHVNQRGTHWHEYKNGQLLRDGEDSFAYVLSGLPYELAEPMPPVAVLTDGKTASAGEIVATAFRGRPNARSFGAPTAGYTTGVLTIELFDGRWLGISDSWYMDRNMKEFRATPIVPDVTTDKPHEDALTWLRDQPACSAAN